MDGSGSLFLSSHSEIDFLDYVLYSLRDARDSFSKKRLEGNQRVHRSNSIAWEVSNGRGGQLSFIREYLREFS